MYHEGSGDFVLMKNMGVVQVKFSVLHSCDILIGSWSFMGGCGGGIQAHVLGIRQRPVTKTMLVSSLLL